MSQSAKQRGEALQHVLRLRCRRAEGGVGVELNQHRLEIRLETLGVDLV